MKTFEKLSEILNDKEETIIFCGLKMEQKLDEEIAEATKNIPSSQVGYFDVSKHRQSLGLKTVHINGVTIHYGSDIVKFMENIKK